LSRKEVGINTKKIIEAIIEFGPRSNTELMKDTGLSKDTIIEYTKRMKNNGQINKIGKKGKWYLTNDAYQHPKLRATLFRKKAMTKILKDSLLIEKKSNFLFADNKNNPINPDSDRNHQSIRQQQDIIIQQQLSRFASKVGCYIVYCFIQAIEPNKWRPKIDITEIEIMLGRDKDKVIKDWIENCIDISAIFREFCNLKIVKQGLARGVPTDQPPTFNKIVKLVAQSSKLKNEEISKSKKDELAKYVYYQYKKIYEQNSKRKLNPEDPNWSLYELDKSTYDGLVKNLKNIYPNLVEELDKIKKGLNDDVKREISFICDPEHTLCKGKIEKVKFQTFFQDTIIKKQCNECKRYFPVELENK
jgi:hypothetical protein